MTKQAPSRATTGKAKAPARAARDSAVARDVRSSPLALDLDNYAVAYLTWIANKISSSASTLYRERFGIGITDWRIMALLAVEPWSPAGRISEVIGFDKAVISRSVAFMLDKGLVETRFHDNNQRRPFVALTHEGLALHDRIVVVAREREEFLLADLDPQERKTVVKLLARIHARAAQLGAARDT